MIAKAGKPLIKVIALNVPEGVQAKRLGFLAGQISLPDDFDRMYGCRRGGTAFLRWRMKLVLDVSRSEASSNTRAFRPFVSLITALRCRNYRAYLT